MNDLGEEPQGTDSKDLPSFTDDFICLSEFSEIVGPVPLFCIPEKARGNFNLEKFVIRIMAVDNQTKSCDPGSFADDTQVVISEPSEDAFAYVHFSHSPSSPPQKKTISILKLGWHSFLFLFFVVC